MNYIAEIKAFQDLVQVKQLSTGQIALWYALMYINNKCAWIEWFTVPNMTLELNSGLSKSGIYKARNVLKQHGIIDFKPNGTKATSYKLFSLSNTTQNENTRINSNQESNQKGNQDSNRIVVPRLNSNRDGNRGSNQDSNQDGNRSGNPLNKLNYTKLNYINNNNNKIDEEFSELIKLYQRAGFDVDGFTSNWIEDSKEIYSYEWVKNAIIEASNQGVRNRAYVNKILRNWKTRGGMTLSTDKKNNSTKGVQANKTKFHNFEGRSEQYSADEINKKVEDIAARKRREARERMKQEGAI